jgi:hypothetical protein
MNSRLESRFAMALEMCAGECYAVEAERMFMRTFLTSADRLAERIASETPASVSWEVIADLLGILEWSIQNNGTAIH